MVFTKLLKKLRQTCEVGKQRGVRRGTWRDFLLYSQNSKLQGWKVYQQSQRPRTGCREGSFHAIGQVGSVISFMTWKQGLRALLGFEALLHQQPSPSLSFPRVLTPSGMPSYLQRPPQLAFLALSSSFRSSPPCRVLRFLLWRRGDNSVLLNRLEFSNTLLPQI